MRIFLPVKTTLFFLLLFSVNGYSQSVDYWHNLSFPGERQAWIMYENDISAATDRYYSQGIAACYKQPLKEGSRLGKLFFPLPGAQKSIGFSGDHMAFTPTTIAFDSIMYDNHPYAATLRANVLFESVNPERGSALSWMLSAGVIGPEAQGEEMQTAIHRATDNPLPKGWDYQLNTGILLDAGMYARQRIAGAGRWFLLVAEESASLGTSRIDLSLGGKMQLQLSNKNARYLFSVYANPAIRLVGYDGTLQGSLIAQGSTVAVAGSRVSRVVFEREFGAMIRLGKFTMTGVFNLHSHQYNDGMTHRWGGIRVGLVF